MLKSLIKDAIIYSFNTVISKGIAFFLIPIFTSVLVPSEYGIIDIFLVLGSVVKVFVGFEITQAFARFYVEVKEKDKPTFVTTSFIFFLVSYTLFFLFIWIFDEPLNAQITDNQAGLSVYYLAFLSIVSNSIFNFWQNSLRWSFKSKLYSINSILFTIIVYGASVFLIVYKGLGLQGYFIANIIGSLSLSILSLYYQRSNLVWAFDLPLLKKMLHFSFPLVFSSVAVVLSNYTDRIVIKEFLNLNSLGIYGIGFRVASMVGLFLTGIRMAVSPLVYGHYKDPSTPKKLADLTTVFALLSFILIIFLSLFSKEIIGVIADEQYFESWKVMPLLAAATLIGNAYIFTPGIGISKKTKYMVYINTAGLVFNLGLNYMLIPIFGIVGAATATILGALLVLSMYVYFSQKLYTIPFEGMLIIGGILLTIIIVIVFGYWIEFQPLDPVSIGIRLLVMLFCFLVIFIVKRATWIDLYSKLSIKLVSKL